MVSYTLVVVGLTWVFLVVSLDGSNRDDISNDIWYDITCEHDFPYVPYTNQDLALLDSKILAETP